MREYVNRAKWLLEEFEKNLQEDMRKNLEVVQKYLEKTLKSGYCTDANLRIPGYASEATSWLEEGRMWIYTTEFKVKDMLKDISRICQSSDIIVYNYRRRALTPLWKDLIAANSSGQYKSVLTEKVFEIEEQAKEYELIKVALKQLSNN